MKLSHLLHITLLTSVILQLPFSETHHVIFEGIGQMAGAVTYLHAKLTINLTAIEDHIQIYQRKLQEFKNNIPPPPADQQQSHYYEPRLFDLRQLHYKQLIKVLEEHGQRTREVAKQVNSIRTMMPPVVTEQSRVIDDRTAFAPQVTPGMMNDEAKSKTSTSDVINDAYKVINLGSQFLPRASKLLPFLPLALGAVGTFMGLFSQAQISNLAKELRLTQDNHNKLVEVVQSQQKAVQELTWAFDAWVRDARNFKINDPGLINSWLNQARSLLDSKLNIVTHAVQQAQHRRLAIDFLSADQLLRLYSRLQSEAKALNCQLLTKHPSDLFQLELSYFFDGENIHLLLHVPAVPHDSLLRLFKLHPFPLPLTSTHSLIPSVRNDILAISSGPNRLSAQFTSSDLMSCHTVNSVQICERHGVLNKHLNSTCLGALYLQELDAVQELCPLEVTPAKEIVHQLLKNWFLIFSPEPQTAYVECRNGTQSELHLKAGISKHFLSPSCKANFRSHLLLSDSSIQLPTDLLHFEWQWDPFTLLDVEPNEVSPFLQELYLSGIHRPTISQIQQLKLQEAKTHGLWYHIVHFIGNLCVFLLILALLGFGTFLLFKRQCRKAPNMALNLLMDPIPRVQPPATAPAFASHQPPPAVQHHQPPAVQHHPAPAYYPPIPLNEPSRVDPPPTSASFPDDYQQ
jgi:hypothetical protein